MAINEEYYRRGEGSRRWGAILLVVGVVWLVFELTSRGSLFGFGFGFVERSEAGEPRQFTAAAVQVSGVSDEIELIGWNQSTIQVEATEHGFGWNDGAARQALDRLEVVVEQRGDTVVVEVRRAGIGRFFGRAPYAELRVMVPAGVRYQAALVSGAMRLEALRGDGSLSTVSGAIDATDTAGTLQITTTSGDVELSGHAGPLVAESVSGDIDATGAIERPQVSTVSGDVDLSGVSGLLDLRSISGEIRVADASDASLRLESTSGDIRFAGALGGASSQIGSISGDVLLELSAPDDLRLELSTTSGDLSSDLDLRDLAEERRSLRGQLGEGSALLTVTTTSGDVEVAAR